MRESSAIEAEVLTKTKYSGLLINFIKARRTVSTTAAVPEVLFNFSAPFGGQSGLGQPPHKPVGLSPVHQGLGPAPSGVRTNRSSSTPRGGRQTLSATGTPLRMYPPLDTNVSIALAKRPFNLH